VVVLVTL